MKALLICPADRPAVAHLAENTPLVAVPLLGRTLLDYWVEWLAARGAKQILVLASDRPNHVRAIVDDGARWGVKVEVVPNSRELSVADARQRYRTADATDWLPEFDVVMLDRLPGQPSFPLFDSYASWFQALRSFMPQAVTANRIGVREIHPGVWVGLHAQIAATAQLHAPCWIGEHAMVGAGSIVGPGTVLDDRAVVENGARIVDSIVGPDTFVGAMTCVQNSLAQGSTLVNWQSGSCLQVPDAFLLSSLEERPEAVRIRPSITARLAAAAAMVVTAPFAVGMMAFSLVQGESPVQLRLGVRPQPPVRRGAMDTFAYYELSGARNWLRRWPQFWSVVRGDLAWFGNRPLRPTQALALSNDFERLWLVSRPGLVSLADAHGCPEGVSDESCAHASFYAVNASPRLHWFMFTRSLYRAASAWPFLRWTRRKEGPVSLTRLVPKQPG